MTKLSVCVVTYNHGLYIEKAIKSIFNQKVPFPFEVIVSEDCSTDDTAQKLKEIFHTFKSRNLKVIYRKKNLGAMNNYIDTLKKCQGEYVALLEGDDYWTDNKKLATQVGFLDQHKDYSISTHNVLVVDETSNSTGTEWLGKNHRQTSIINDLMREGTGGATSSVVFRKNSLFPLPSWFDKISGNDWATQILCTGKGKMYYFPKTMGIYRRHTGGITDFTSSDDEEVRAFTLGGVHLCNVFNEHFHYRYDKEIKINLVSYFYPNLVNIYKRRKDYKNARKYAYKILTGEKPRSLILPKNWFNLLSTFHL